MKIDFVPVTLTMLVTLAKLPSYCDSCMSDIVQHQQNSKMLLLGRGGFCFVGGMLLVARIASNNLAENCSSSLSSESAHPGGAKQKSSRRLASMAGNCRPKHVLHVFCVAMV